MSRDLLDLVRELNTLNDDNLADRVIENSDVQWCLSELQDILEEMPTLTPPNEALTIEQLRDMDGEPVYLVAPKYGISEWNVLNGMDEIVLAYDEPVVGMKAVVPGIKFINGRVFGVGSYARRREKHE